MVNDSHEAYCFGDDFESTYQAKQGEYTDLQKMQMAVLEKVNQQLKDGIDYHARLGNVKVEHCPKGSPILIFSYNVDGGKKLAEDKYFFRSAEYIPLTIERLNKMLNEYNHKLDTSDFKSVETIKESCNCLIGQEVTITQKTVNDYPTYSIKVIA